MKGSGQKETQQWRQKDSQVFGAKQQLDGCTASIMNPIEGEQEPGGQPFRGVHKAISTVPPLFMCVGVRVCLCVHTHTPSCTSETGGQPENGIMYGIENCFLRSWSVLLKMDWPRQASIGKSPPNLLWFE